MKKMISIMCLFVGLLGYSQASTTVLPNGTEVINFPDPNFECVLITRNVTNAEDRLDMDGDGRISLIEAERVTQINNFIVLQDHCGTITNMDGIEYFVNLESIEIGQVEVPIIDLNQNLNLDKVFLTEVNTEELLLPTNSNITSFSIDSSKIANFYSIDFFQHPSLKSFSYTSNVNNDVKTLDLSNLPIEYLMITNNSELLDINLFQLSNLTYAQIGNNDKITSLDLSLSNNLDTFYVDFNELLESIQLPLESNLTSLNINSNASLHCIDFSKQTNLTELQITQNELLEHLDLRNCKLSTLFFYSNPKLKSVLATNQPFNNGIYDFSDTSQPPVVNFAPNNCPELEFICIDEVFINDVEAMKTDPVWQFILEFSDYSVSSNCDEYVQNTSCNFSEACEPITFIDPFFKEALLNHTPVIDTNGDGEICIEEAEVVNNLYIVNYNIKDITEIRYFMNVETAFFVFDEVNELDFTSNTKLNNLTLLVRGLIDSLDFGSLDLRILSLGVNLNNGVNLDLSPHTNLEHLSVNYYGKTQFSSVNFNQNNAIKKLSLIAQGANGFNIDSNTNINDLDLSNFLYLEDLDLKFNYISNNHPSNISEFDFSNNNFLERVKIHNSVIENINLDANKKIKELILDSNDSLLNVNASVESLETVSITQNCSLENIYMKGYHSFYDSDNFDGFLIQNAPDIQNDTICLNKLKLICIDPIGNFDEFEFYVHNDLGYNDVVVTSAEDCSIEEDCIVEIPDTNFKNTLISKGIDVDGDSEISCTEAETVTTLDVSISGISDLTGIEAFVNLQSLTSINNSIDTLNLSSNKELTFVNLWLSGVSSLDVSGATKLQILRAPSNNLTSLDVSKNAELTTLWVDSNNLTSLDVSNNSKLVSIRFGKNDLTSLNLANGNNSSINHLRGQVNPNLECIQVDNDNISFTFVDAGVSFSTDCSPEVTIFPDPNKKYYIDNLQWNVRLGADGSQDAFTTNTSTTGETVEWIITPSPTEGYYYIDCVGGGSVPRLRSDQSINADMQATSSAGTWTRWIFTDVGNGYYYLSTLKQSNFMRLQVNSSGNVRTVEDRFTGNWTHFKFTEVSEIANKGISSSFTVYENENHQLGNIPLNLFPNPVIDYLNIVSETEIEKVEIYNLNGFKVLETKDLSINFNNLSSGMYIVKTYTINGTVEVDQVLKK